MLHYEARQLLCHERQQERLREAEAERLVNQARGARQRRRRMVALAARFDRLLHPRRQVAGHGAGA